jgi:hypothetical protein
VGGSPEAHKRGLIQAHTSIIMKCACVKSNLVGQVRSMYRDDHGFWTVKYDS